MRVFFQAENLSIFCAENMRTAGPRGDEIFGSTQVGIHTPPLFFGSARNWDFSPSKGGLGQCYRHVCRQLDLLRR